MEPLAHRRLTIVTPKQARAAIAHLVLDEFAGEPAARGARPQPDLGSITLHSHQASAVGPLRAAIQEFGGALLCDPVGTGKTYVALALSLPENSVLVVAPAVLREMWVQAAAAAHRKMAFTSFEALSRGAESLRTYDLLIVDEAHHARNPATRRYGMLSRLASRSSVLLLSATPIHNRRQDLLALLSLFLGERARGLTSAELGRCVVRRETAVSTNAAIPRSDPLVWMTLSEDEAIPRMLLALPPPLPVRDGGDAGCLVVHSLIRQWASSSAALEGGLRRRLQKATALIAALVEGTWPSRSELATWIGAEGIVQLGFACLLSPPAGEVAGLLPVIEAHRDAVASALREVRRDLRADEERAAILRGVRAAHPGRRIVAFSQYADTVDALFRRLAPDGEVAALTGSGARVAGGRISRSEAIARFAPLASGRPQPTRAEAISLLLTTDLLSEGVNLQDASVVVHLDLPWTPARMEQRLGRIARIGSAHATVFAYAVHPPASAEAIIRIENILESKMEAAGLVIADFPSLRMAMPDGLTRPANAPGLIEAYRHRLASWLDHGLDERRNASSVSAVSAGATGFLAAYVHSGRVHLVGCSDGRIGDDPELILECIDCCEGKSLVLPVNDFVLALGDLDSWMRATSAMETVFPTVSGRAHTRNKALRRISAASRASRPHDRPRVSRLAQHARLAVLGVFGSHAERELDQLCDIQTPDDAWLERVIDFGRRNQSKSVRPKTMVSEQEVALVLFRNTIALTPATKR